MHGRPRSLWIPLVDAVERGADPRHVAEQGRVNPSTPAWWRTVLRREQPAGVPAMLPVVLRAPSPPEAPTASASIEATVAGSTLRVPVGADVAYVAAPVRALERGC